MMKKILALCVCLCLLSGAALAELSVPTLPPSQSEMRMSFLTDLLQFVLGTDLDRDALSFDLTQNDQTLASALLQKAEGVLDLDGNFGGLPVRAELTDDALLALYDGQLYKLPIDQFMPSTPDAAADAADGNADAGQELIKMLDVFRDTVVMPSISMEEVDGNQHIRIDCSADRFIAFGDAIFANEQFLALFSMMSPDFNIASLWPELRAQLASGQIPLSLTADVTIGFSGLRGKAEGALFGTTFSLDFNDDGENVVFSGECDGVHKVSGSYNLYTGAFDYHSVSGDARKIDAVYAPDMMGWTADLEIVREAHAMSLHMKDDIDAFSLTSSHTLSDAQARREASFTLDKETLVMDGEFHVGDVTAVLAGAPTEDGYHATLDVTQGGTPVHSVDFVLAVNDDMVAVTLNSIREGGDLIWSSSFAIATETGAYTYRYDGADGTFIDSNGIISDEETSGVVDCGQDGVVNARFEVRRIDDDSVYSQSYTGYAMLAREGNMSKLFESSFTFDKATNGFFGAYRIPAQHIDVQAQGICGDSVFKLKVDAQGRTSGRLDLSWIKGDEGVMGNLDFASIGLSLTGDLLLSPYMKSLSAVINNQNRVKATLSQDEYGNPQELQISGNIYGMPGLRMRPVVFSVVATKEQLLVKVDGRTTVVKGGFRDAHTYVLDVVQNEGMGNRELNYEFSATADPGQLILRLDSLSTGDYLEARLARADRTGFESFAGRDDAVALTPELLQQMLQSVTETPEPQAQAAASATAGGAAG